MKRQPWQTHVTRCRGNVQSTKNHAQPRGVLRLDPRASAGRKKPFEASVTELDDRHIET